MNNYLDILKESLVKKIEVLGKIKEATFAQKEILGKESFDMEAFDSYVDEKDGYIDELMKLDEGFDSLYKKVSKELEGNKEKYTAEIAEMKKLISEITALSSAIEAQEARNRDMVTKYFSKAKKKLGQQRRSNKAAFDYYKSVAGYNGENSVMMDEKK